MKCVLCYRVHWSVFTNCWPLDNQIDVIANKNNAFHRKYREVCQCESSRFISTSVSFGQLNGRGFGIEEYLFETGSAIFNMFLLLFLATYTFLLKLLQRFINDNSTDTKTIIVCACPKYKPHNKIMIDDYYYNVTLFPYFKAEQFSCKIVCNNYSLFWCNWIKFYCIASSSFTTIIKQPRKLRCLWHARAIRVSIKNYDLRFC